MTLPRSRIVELDARHVWHPYTPMDRYLAEGRPLVIDSAAGVRLRDLDGRAYLDGNASWWTSLLGHQHLRRGLMAEVRQGIHRLAHLGFDQTTHFEHARGNRTQFGVELGRQMFFAQGEPFSRSGR